MPGKSARDRRDEGSSDEALKDKGMPKERAARIANSPDASKHGGECEEEEQRYQGGTTSPEEEGGRKGGKASHS